MPSTLPFDRLSGPDRALGAPEAAPVVLVAEDDPHLLRLITQGFIRAGYAAFPAGDGRVALQMVEALQPDLLVTDIVMPEKEGLATIIEARRAAPAMGVIAISGGGCYGRTGNFLQWAQQLGADQALAKPFALSELLAVARDVLERRGASLPTAVARLIP
jgi:DNA-binding response OmpR family regulator